MDSQPPARAKMTRKFLGALIAIVVSVGSEGSNAQVAADSLVAKLSITSQSDSVEVDVGSHLLGVTPCTIAISNQGVTILTFRKEGYVAIKDTIRIGLESDSSIIVRLTRLTKVTISSEPSNAEVTIGGTPFGRTPITITGILSDTMHIFVRLWNYEPWASDIFTVPGGEFRLTAKLKRIESSISVLVKPPGSSVFVDDTIVSHGSLVNYPVAPGVHRVSMRDDSTGRSGEVLSFVTRGVQYYYVGELGYPSIDRAVFGSVFPGVMQLTDRSIYEGSILLAATLATGYNLVLANREYDDRLTQYDLAVASYIVAPTETEATRRHEDVLSRKSDVDKYYVRRQVSTALFAACYVYNIADVFLNHLLSDKIELVPWWTMENQLGAPISNLPSGAQLKIKL